MDSKLPAGQIQDVLSYINKIQEYDRKYFRRVTVITAMVWGILFLYAGVMDFFFFLTNHPEYSIVPWFITSVGGGLVTIFISSFKQGELTSDEVKLESDEYTRMHKFTLIFIITGWVLTSILGILGLIQLIMPWVGFMIFISMVSSSNKQPVTITNLLSPSSGILFVATLSLLSVVINLVGLFIMGTRFQVVEGLILGLCVGSGFVQFSIRMRYFK